MNIEELKEKHSEIFWMDDVSNTINIRLHTKLSIEFVISVLKELDENNIEILGNTFEYFAIHDNIENKIQELKQYLDG